MSEYSRFRSHLHLSEYARLGAILLFVSFVLVACGTATPQEDTGSRDNATTATPQPWLVSAVPITLDSVADIQVMGRLDQPDIASTIMDVALSPDNTRLAALTNTQLVVWDLLTGAAVFATGRGDATQLFYSPDKSELYGLTPAGNRAAYDLNKNGAIEVSELYAGVKRQVVDQTKSRQTPWLARNQMIGDFALF